MPEPATALRPQIQVKGSWYVIKNRSYPRVSTVLDIIHEEGLDKWRAKVGDEEADRISETSQHLGNAVHAACAALAIARRDGTEPTPLEEQYLDVADQLPPFTGAFAGWLATEVRDVLFVEETVWCDEPVFAGTIDLVVRKNNGRVSVMDIKTSKRVRTKYRLQTAAYLRALYERTGIEAEERGIVHLPSDKPGAIGDIPLTDYEDDWQAFTAALFLHQYVWFFRRDWLLSAKKVS